MSEMFELARQVAAQFPAGRRPDVDLIDTDQLLVSTGMISDPDRPPGEKTPVAAPAPDGYEIHVAVRRPANAERPERPSQLARPPAIDARSSANPAVGRGERFRTWTYRLQDGSRMVLTVRVGSDAVLDDVNTILDMASDLLSR